MIYKLREYQQKASDIAVDFFTDKNKRYNAIEVIPTGGGKSLILADIASRLNGCTLVFQPSKEILQQNFKKLCSFGVLDCSIYSASFNQKNISRITFATIGSVINHPEFFKMFSNIIVDECHYCNSKDGMYKRFFEELGDTKILGLTATPYRLASNSFGSMLRFITRTRPRIFSKVIYSVQISTLLDMGYLADLSYYTLKPPFWRDENLIKNSAGSEFSDKSIFAEYQRIDFYRYLIDIVSRLLHPKSGKPRKGILVFTRFLKEAEMLSRSIYGCRMISGDTPKEEREYLIKEFKKGTIKVIANVGILTTGFDYPELDTVVLARPTMSLGLFYQMIGRTIRPYKDKDGWIVDLCGNVDRFGKVQDLRLVEEKKDLWAVHNKERQLTNVIL